ncbi:MAG: tetratricopeptide repeat protein [Pirellulales bacterium]
MALTVLAIVATFWPVLGHRLLSYDDPTNVLVNPFLNPLTWRNVLEVWRSPYSGVYVPVTNMFFAAETWLAEQAPVARGAPLQVDARVYHAGNLLLHIGATIVLFGLLRKLLERDLPALVGALVFALHPLMAEPVAWVTETKCLLSGVLGFFALLMYVKFIARHGSDSASGPSRRRQQGARFGDWLWFAAASLAYLLALLSKPTAAAIPLMAAVLAVGWAPLGSLRDKQRAVAWLVPLAIWLLAAATLAYFTKQQQPDIALDYVPRWHERPLIALDALGFYLRKIALPFDLSPDYAHSARVVLDAGWRSWNWPLAVAFPALLVAFRAPRPLWVASGLFVAGLSPVLGLVPFGYQSISTVADRYVYLPLAGLALAVGWALSRLGPSTGARALTRRVGYGFVLAVGLVFGVLAHRQCRVWSDDLTLADAGLVVSPASAQLRSLRAGALENGGHLDAALAEYEKTAEIAPRSAMVRLFLAQAYQRRGREADALRLYHEALELQPTFPGAHLALGSLLKKQGHFEQAAKHFAIARKLDTTSRLARRYLADCLRELGKPAEAIPFYREALDIQRTDAETWDQLAGTLAELGDQTAAIEAYQHAIDSNPRDPSLHNHLGSYLMQVNRAAEALAPLRAGLELEPHSADNQHNVGVALLLTNQPAEALPHFQEEVRLRPEDANALFHLGTTYQRLGDAQAAVQWFRAAVERDPQSFAALVGLAGSATQLGDVDSAIAAYRQALPLEPRNAQVHNALGVLLARRGERREAAEQFNAALAIDPAYNEARANLQQVQAAGS